MDLESSCSSSSLSSTLGPVVRQNTRKLKDKAKVLLYHYEQPNISEHALQREHGLPKKSIGRWRSAFEKQFNGGLPYTLHTFSELYKTKLHKLKGRTFHEGPKNDGEHLKVWVANHIDKMNDRGISVSGPNLAIAIAMNHPEFKDRNHIKILDWVYRFLYTSPYSVR